MWQTTMAHIPKLLAAEFYTTGEDYDVANVTGTTTGLDMTLMTMRPTATMGPPPAAAGLTRETAIGFPTRTAASATKPTTLDRLSSRRLLIGS